MSEGRFHVFMTERKTEHRIMTQFRSENSYISFGVDHNYLRHFPSNMNAIGNHFCNLLSMTNVEAYL